jgi:hypothetical protein
LLISGGTGQENYNLNVLSRFVPAEEGCNRRLSRIVMKQSMLSAWTQPANIRKGENPEGLGKKQPEMRPDGLLRWGQRQK